MGRLEDPHGALKGWGGMGRGWGCGWGLLLSRAQRLDRRGWVRAKRGWGLDNIFIYRAGVGSERSEVGDPQAERSAEG